MLKIQDIKTIILGPRQLTFAFGNNDFEIENIVFSQVSELFKIHGQIILDQLIDCIEQSHDLPRADILQSIFWSAEELKLHFRYEKQTITPLKAKQLLLKNLKTRLELDLNKDVEDVFFQEMVLFFQKISPNLSHEIETDQYQFAVSLRAELDKWIHTLKSYKPMARKKWFPGEKLISDYLHSLEMLLKKKDRYSLITICHDHMGLIEKIAGDVKTLSSFFKNDFEFWNRLIQSLDKFADYTNDFREDQEIFRAYNRLNLILKSVAPYPLVSEAKHLLAKVDRHYTLIIKEKTDKYRSNALFEIDTMIDRLSGSLREYRSDQDQRNHMLYPLRSERKKIQNSNTLLQISELINQTKDLYDDFMELLEHPDEQP